MYFTTTRAHQEMAGARFVDVIIDEAHDSTSLHPFKGNVDLKKFEAVVNQVGARRVPYISVAATVNMAGGQPISLENLKAVHGFARSHGIKVILDATRAMENAFFHPTAGARPVRPVAGGNPPGDVRVLRRRDHEREEGPLGKYWRISCA
jgi:tryptophanase